MKALAQAAAARQKKKAAGIEAGFAKTESFRNQKNAALKVQKEDAGDVEKQKRVAAAFAKAEEERKQAAAAAKAAKEEEERLKDMAEKEVQARKAAEIAKAEAEQKRLAKIAKEEEERQKEIAEKEEQERKAAEIARAEAEEERLAAIAKAAKEEEDRLKEIALKEEQERKAAEIARVEAERKRLADIEAAEKAAAAKLVDDEKRARIEAAAAYAEEVRMAKLHGENEESSKWKRPPNLGLGKGEKPPAFKTGRRSSYQNEEYDTVPTLAGAGGIPGIAQMPTGQVVAEPSVKPKEIIDKPAQYTSPTKKVKAVAPASAPVPAPAAVVTPAAAAAAAAGAPSPGPEPRPIPPGVTQEDLKQYARKLPEEAKPAEIQSEYKQTHAFVMPDPKEAQKYTPDAVAGAKPVEPVSATEPATEPAPTVDAEAKKSTPNVTTTTTSYTVKSEPSAPPAQAGCCTIL